MAKYQYVNSILYITTNRKKLNSILYSTINRKKLLWGQFAKTDHKHSVKRADNTKWDHFYHYMTCIKRAPGNLDHQQKFLIHLVTVAPRVYNKIR